MALTDTAIKVAKPGAADRKLADGKGLYLLVTTTGSKLWRLKYRLNGKEKKLALGAYPEVGLEDARARRDEARKAAETGRDPAVAKREARIAKRIAAANTFGAIAHEYIAKLEAEGRAPVTIGTARWLLSKLTPALGTRPVAEITPHELLAVLKATERAGQRSARQHGGCDLSPVGCSATRWRQHGRPSILRSPFKARWFRRSRATMRRSPIQSPSTGCCARSRAMPGSR